MIYLGLDNQSKNKRIISYCEAQKLEHIIILTPQKFAFECAFAKTEQIEWAQIIQYKFFYRLLQEIGNQTLIVLNECLRTQNRYDLTYNCIRHFLNQTPHQIIFQYLPMIESINDFMILFDFDTRSRWKREKLRADLLTESQIEIASVTVALNRIEVNTSDQLRVAYQKEKEKLIENIGLKDPHTIPRNLYLMSGKAKLKYIETAESSLFGARRYYIGRNNRFKLERLQPYKESIYPNTPYRVLEFCHNFMDFADFLSLSRQTYFDVLVADLRVDEWYFQRYQAWAKRLTDAYSSIQRKEKCA